MSTAAKRRRRYERTGFQTCLAALLNCAAIFGFGAGALASGFQNDDASITEPGRFLFDVAWVYTRAGGEASGGAPTAELYYGLAPRVEMHVIASLAYDRPRSGHTAVGPGDTELALKYRIREQSENDWWPAVAFEPTVDLPSGAARRKLGTGHAHAFLPIWLEKNLGDWDLFGGAGFGLNPGAGKKNNWFEGIGIGRGVRGELWLGAEIFHQSADQDRGKSMTGFNVGGSLALAEQQRLLLTVGRGVQNAERTNQFTSYLGYQVGF
jgi:hypothetical protein